MRNLAGEPRGVTGPAGQDAASNKRRLRSAVWRTYIPPFDMTPASTQRSCKQDVFREHIGESLVDGCSDVVEFRDKRVFEPVDQHLGDDHE